ncbi:MAG: WcbI family polysaccharide biosynthesis putative acetyltransferase [Pseudomonadota bacterium]
MTAPAPSAPALQGGAAKVLFYGNCQMRAVATAISLFNPQIDIRFAGMVDTVGNFDPARAEKLQNWADVIVARTITKASHPANTQKLRERWGERLLVVPYISVDAMFPLAPSEHLEKNPSGFVDGAEIIASLEEVGLEETLARYRAGEIDFNLKARFEQSLRGMARREQGAIVQISPWLAEHCRQRQLFLSRNHPKPEIINMLASAVAERIGAQFSEITRDQAADYARITLPLSRSKVSPQAAEELGLAFGYDLGWWQYASSTIRRIDTFRRKAGSGWLLAASVRTSDWIEKRWRTARGDLTNSEFGQD